MSVVDDMMASLGMPGAPVTDEGMEDPNLVLQAPTPERPIDRLRPNSELHKKVLEMLRERQRMSADKMAAFYPRWRAAENRYQAYINAKELDEIRKAANETGKPPEFTTVTVPYSYATVMTIVTYLVHTFCGNKPMFQVDSYREDVVERAQKMETVLQYNADHIRLIRRLYQFFHDGEVYGLQVLRVTWRQDNVRRTSWKQMPTGNPLMQGPTALQSTQDYKVVFEGNDVVNIDPFAFFPDPRVPMDQVSERGEFVFWQHFEGKHVLKRAEQDGLLSYIDAIQPLTERRGEANSDRGRLADGDSHAGPDYVGTGRANDSYKLLQGTVDIIPKDWGLGDSEGPEKWMFTWANDSQIIQAEPLDADHDRHPVVVGEPYSTGYSFGNFAVTDLLGPMQDTLSWLINSHVHNVRAVLNNELVVNPQMVDINDLKKRGPGRVIKMLPAAFGQDPKMAVQQLQVQDVTQSHINDMSVIQRLADSVSAVNDNLRGVQTNTGRKSATEVRTSGEAGASRLASHAMLISSQSICPLAEMMSLNTQQYMSQPFYIKVVGKDGLMQPLRVDPQDLAGDFYYPVHDGTLPMDRVAMLGVWKEIFQAVTATPGLMEIFNIAGIFEYVAKLSGAKNITQFKVQTADPNQIAGQVQAGNMVPMGAQR